MGARTGSTQQFLLIYDHERDEFLSYELFGDDVVAAATACHAAEIEYQGHPEMDIVLVGAESSETIKVTYGTYFTESVARLLDEIRAGVS